MHANFGCALLVTLALGGYSDNPKDPGGPTNLGITIGTLSDWLGRPATKAEVKELTPARVRPIYKQRYWDAVRGDDLPTGVDLVTFDAAVNSRPTRGAKWTQAAAGVRQDGKIGPITLAALRKADPAAIVKGATDRRLRFLQGLSTWKTFGRGWGRRVGEIRATALSWIGASPAAIHEDADSPDAQGRADAVKSRSAGVGSATSAGAAAAQFHWPSLIAFGLIAAALIGLALFLHLRSRAKREAAKAAREVASRMETA